MNYAAICIWIFLAGVGYLIGDTFRSAVIGFIAGLGLSLLATIVLPSKR